MRNKNRVGTELDSRRVSWHPGDQVLSYCNRIHCLHGYSYNGERAGVQALPMPFKEGIGPDLRAILKVRNAVKTKQKRPIFDFFKILYPFPLSFYSKIRAICGGGSNDLQSTPIFFW